jgi:GT2 family glycosyltransferase
MGGGGGDMNNICLMNNCLPSPVIHGIAYSQYIEDGILLLDKGTFVSMLVHQRVIETIGFPIKEFFIWSDDAEYSERIIKAGFFGVFVFDSKVIHKTAQNYGASIQYASTDMFWRFYYGKRNEVYRLKKRYKTIAFLCHYVIKIIRDSRLCLKNQNGRFNILKQVLHGLIAGLFFNPEIEYCRWETPYIK